MKKILLFVVLGICVVAAFIFLRPAEKPAAKPQTESVEKKAGARPRHARPPLLDTDVLEAVRRALASPDKAGLDDALNALTEYINAHPEKVDEYVAAFHSEQDEYVLRTLARAIAASNVGLLENEKILEAAKELAKDPSFEQRQHIMLHMMSSLPKPREDVFKTISEVSSTDPRPQVRNSGMAALADWMQQFPDKHDMLIEPIVKNFKTETDKEVLPFTYQLLALHNDKLPRDIHAALGDRLKTERDCYNGNMIANALFTAPDDIRADALAYVRSRFEAERDEEVKRNELIQILSLSRGDQMQPFLQQLSSGDSELARDAKNYLALLSLGGPLDPNMIIQQKTARDAAKGGANHSCADHAN